MTIDTHYTPDPHAWDCSSPLDTLDNFEMLHRAAYLVDSAVLRQGELCAWGVTVQVGEVRGELVRSVALPDGLLEAGHLGAVVPQAAWTWHRRNNEKRLDSEEFLEYFDNVKVG